MPDLIEYSTVSSSSYITVNGTADFGGEYISGTVTKKEGINPMLAFRYIKRKFGTLEKITIERRLKKLEKAFDQAIENGQEALGMKLLKEVARETKESAIYTKGFRHFIEKDDISRVKYKVRNGHISDTLLENYTRFIPKDVIVKKKESDGLFDGYVVYHYWNQEAEEKREKKDKKMTDKEKADMKDPILFGTIRESNRLYFIADWEDEFCDLTFDELVGIIPEGKLTKFPKLEL